MSEIVFLEDTVSGYAHRTMKNASADATLAIFIHFKTAGERLTRQCVLEQRKIYVPLSISRSLKANIPELVQALKGVKSLNIAGNGMYTMNDRYSQQELDKFVYELLKVVVPLVGITSIRSGGQTGADEAGAKAGARLDLPTTVLAPKGWKFRTAAGVDISNEVLFKERFIWEHSL